MTVRDLIQLLAPWLAVAPVVGNEVELIGATWDSRKIMPGMLFCAIRGAVSDGNRFIPEAVAAGAVAVVSDSDPQVSEDVPVVRI